MASAIVALLCATTTGVSDAHASDPEYGAPWNNQSEPQYGAPWNHPDPGSDDRPPERDEGVDHGERYPSSASEDASRGHSSADDGSGGAFLAVILALIAIPVVASIVHGMADDQSHPALPAKPEPHGPLPASEMSQVAREAQARADAKTRKLHHPLPPSGRVEVRSAVAGRVAVGSASGVQAQFASSQETVGIDPVTLHRLEVALLILLGVFAATAFLGLVIGWRLFSKAGRSGWLILIPIYNWWVLLEICGQPGWLAFIPIANWFATVFMVPFWIAERFGKSRAFAFGLLVLAPLFYPLLAFGRARYMPAAQPAAV